MRGPARRGAKVVLGAFARAVDRVVRGIPRGETRSYGEVALLVGKPGAARAVVRALHQLDDIPWWRVTRKGGALAPAVAHQQAQLLAAERPRARKRLPAPLAPARARVQSE